MPNKTFDLKTPAYKYMSKMNKEHGRGSYGVVNVGKKFRVEKRLGGKTYNDKKTAHQSFNFKNTTTIKGKNPKLSSSEFKIKMKSIEKQKQDKIKKRRDFLKKDIDDFKKREIIKVRRAQLKRGETIKSERRELLKKGLL